MIVIILLAIVVLYLGSFFVPNLKEKTKSTRYGSAYFREDSILSEKNRGFTIDGVRSLSVKKSYRHGFLVAPTGSGKTTQILLPSMINHALNGNANVIIVDPKAELTPLLTPVYEKNGYKVLCLDFENPLKSLGYNPLNKQQCKTEDDVKQLAHDLFSISTSNARNSEAIWSVGAKKILSVLINCILNLEDTKLHTLDTLIQVLGFLEDGSPKGEYFVKTNSPNERVWQQFLSFKNSELKIKLGFLASAFTIIDAFDTEKIRHLTSHNTFPFEELRTEKLAIFLKLQDSSKYSSFLSLFFTQLFRFLLNTPLCAGDRDFFIYLEELPAIKRINLLHNSVALLRSKKVAIMSVTQNLSALDRIYGKENTNTLLSNSASIIVLPGVREERTLAYIEKIMGHKTVEKYVSGRPMVSRRSLLDQSEIRTLQNSGIFIYAEHPPEKLKNIVPIYNNPSLMKKAGLISSVSEVLQYKEPYTPITDATLPPYEPVTIDMILDPEKHEAEIELEKILAPLKRD